MASDVKLVTRSFTMPAWMAEELSAAATKHERTDSGELRWILAATFGRCPDGTPIEGGGLKPAAPIGGAGVTQGGRT